MKAPAETRILIVDDDADLREAMSFDFRRKGFQILEAGSGREALRALREQGPIDVVLSDGRMADGDGIELLDNVKAMNVTVPVVILITGYANISAEEAFDKGADAIFSKPFDREALMQTVLRCLKSMEARYLRKSLRVVSDLPVGLHFKESGFSAEVRALNIGRGGFFAQIYERFPKLEACEFRLESGTEPCFEMSGTGIVRWVRNHSVDIGVTGCGVEFQELDEHSGRRICELINFIQTKSFIPAKIQKRK